MIKLPIKISNPVPSPTYFADYAYMIPEYDPYEPNEKYPGDIQPGYYTVKQLVELVLFNINNPKALRFIADLMETGEPSRDGWIRWIRKNKNNEKGLQKVANEFVAVLSKNN